MPLSLPPASRTFASRSVPEYSREIDLFEVRDQHMQAFECKLNPRQKDNGGSEFRAAYPDCPIHVVTPENALDYLGVP